MAPSTSSAFSQLQLLAEKEREQQKTDPTHIPSRNSLRDMKRLFEELGCEQPVFKKRQDWDQCLTAQLFLRAVDARM